MRKFYKFKVLATLVALFATVASYAVPALPTPVKVRQADGSELTVQKFGDEFFNWTTTTDGYNIAQQNGIYYYVNVNNDGTRVITNQKANQIKSSNEIQFLSQFKNADMKFMSSSIGNQARIARSNEMQKLGDFPNEGKVKSIILLIDYKDVKFGVSSPKDAFTNSLNKPGYSENGSTGSAYDYYTYNSNGKFDPEFVIAGPFTLSQDMAYYGGNDAKGNDLRPREMAIEAVEMASAAGVDFSQYDYDKDGVIDNVFLYYAGYNEAEGGPAETIWPHRWVVNKNVIVNGKQFSGYACSSEYRGRGGAIQAGIGTFCHEFGHVFGIADLYDTGTGVNPGLGNFDLMTSGSYNNNGCTPPLMNSLERMQIGWASPILITMDKDVEMKPLSSSEVYRINTDIAGEYFLLENRQQTDCVWEKYIPASGLGIVHIDQSAAYASYWNGNKVNATAHECAKFIYANNTKPLDSRNSNWANILYGNANKEWSPASTPKNVSWSGKTNQVALKNITIDPITKNVKFNAVVPTVAVVQGTVSSTLGAPLSGVSVKFIKKATAQQTKSEGGIARIVSDPSTYEYTTNSMGGYKAELPEGDYIVTAELANHSNYANVISLSKGELKLDIVLKTNVEANFTKKTFSTGTPKITIDFEDLLIAPFTKYTAADMKLLTNYDLRQIRTMVSSACKIKFMVLSAKDVTKVVYSKDVSVSEGGYAMVELNAGDLMIKPNQDYYVGYQVLEQPDGVVLMLDNATTTNTRESIWFGGRWFTISQTVNQTVPGNLMTELFLAKKAGYVEPTSVTVAATQQVALKGTATLTAKVMPESANQMVTWSSSDASTVLVDQTGAITGLVKGTATIMATSQINGKIVGKCEVTVGDGIPASVKGAVKGVDNGAVADATVQFIEKDPTAAPAQVSHAVAAKVAEGTQFKAASNGVELSSVLYKTQASGKTDAEGNYAIDELLSGPSYDVLISGSPKYDPFFGTLAGLKAGENVLNIPGVKLNPLFDKNEHQYHNGTPRSGVGSATSPLEFGIRIKKEDLKVGNRLMGVTFNANQLLNPTVFISVYFEEDLTTSVVDLQGTGVAGLNRFTFGGVGISIPDNQDVIVSIYMIGYMSLDTGKAVEGYGNLVLDNGAWVAASSLNPAFTGNWMISAYTEEAEPVNITEIKIAEPTEQLTIGAEIQLKSSFLPKFATYRTLAWTSSDENMATVDEKGVVTGLAEGPVTITATSVDADKKSASISFEVALKQAVVGQVKDVEGMIVSGGTLTFIPVTKSVAKVGELEVVTYEELLTKSEPIVATTDEKGMFDVNIPVGDYRVTVSGKGCSDLKQSITITKGLNKMDFSLVTKFSTTSKEYGYTDETYTSAIGAGGGAFGAFAKWGKADLVSQKDSKITRFKFHINDVCKITAMIVVGGDLDNPLYQKDITVSGPGWQVLKLTPDEFVDVPQDKDLYVGYYLSEYGDKAYPASTGSNATNDGKGNVLFMNGSWTTAKAAGVEGNWMISYYGQTQEQIDGIDLSVGQIDANLSWSSAGYEQFQVSIKEGVDGATPTVVETTDTKFAFEDLKPATTYSYQVAGLKEGEYVPMFGKEFTTMAKINDNPMVLVTKNEFNVGEMLLLKVINVSPEDVVTWYINDVEQQYSEVNLDTKGTLMVKCKIAKPGAKTIFTVKKITVK